MNKEQIEARLKDLQTAKDQLQSNLLAHEGAIQDCNYWLQQLEMQIVETTKEETT